MPSPIGHALAGVSAGWLVAPADPAGRAAAFTRAAIFAAAGMAPDLDLLVGAHSGPTHGLGAALIVGAVAWVWSARLQASRSRAGAGAGGAGSGGARPTKGPASSSEAVRFALALAAAYASHTLLDWLGSDTSPPIGIMALWPFSRAYSESSLHLFQAISRRYWLPDFWTYNLKAVLRELIILVPPAAAVILFRRPAGRA
jgi:membrane-bound metal-dependent hydrolase YbcI (DUF457 family)